MVPISWLELVLDDQQGELIGDVVRNGRVDKGMPKFDLAAADISAIATFLHSQPTGDRSGRPSTPINILVGDAKAGEAYFNGSGKCSTCHSVTGDLAGIGAKYDPKTLQNLLVSGGGGGRGFGPRPATLSQVPPTTVTVTLLSGRKYEGKLVHMDAFTVSLIGKTASIIASPFMMRLPKSWSTTLFRRTLTCCLHSKTTTYTI